EQRPAAPVAEHRRRARAAAGVAERPGGGAAAAAAAGVQDPAAVKRGDPPGAGGDPDRRAGRLLSGPAAGWLAAGRLLHQPARYGELAQVRPADPDLSRGLAG